MQQHGIKYFACRSPPPPQTFGVGSIGQNSTFSEHGPVSYQIIENHQRSNMVANVLPADHTIPPTLTLGMRSVGQISSFSEHGHVAYQFKGDHEIKQHGTNILLAEPPLPRP